MSRTTRTILVVLLVAYLAGVLLITLWPSTATTPGVTGAREAISGARERGAPSGFTFGSMERLANLFVFIPIGALVALLVPRRLWVMGAVAGGVLSAAIEATQFFFLPGRDSSWRDILLNTTGALIGAVFVFVIVTAIRTRRSSARMPVDGR